MEIRRTGLGLLLTTLLSLGLMATVASAATRASLDLAEGRATFTLRCSPCHDADGGGDGPLHTRFIPPPANLTAVKDAPAMIVSIIRYGIQGTAMPAFHDLSDITIGNIIAYVLRLPLFTEYQWDYAWRLRGIPAPPLMASRMYVTTCSGCHGPTGNGRTAYAMADLHFWPKPANFKARNSELGRNYFTITSGRRGTMMPPQRYKLTEQARWSLAQYVTAMLDPKSLGTIPTGRMELYRNPFSPRDMAVVSAGRELSDLYCSPCHGPQENGSFLAPKLVDRIWLYGGGTDNAVFMLESKGIPGKLMPSFAPLPESQRWSIITYLRYRGGLPDPLALVGRTEAD